jgi:hypothetical protein
MRMQRLVAASERRQFIVKDRARQRLHDPSQ